MKKIVDYLKDYLQKEFHVGVYVLLLIFLGVAIWYNYEYDFMQRVIYRRQGAWMQWLLYIGFFSLPYFFALFTDAALRRKWDFLYHRGFWLTVAFLLLLLSFTNFFPWHRRLSAVIFEPAGQFYGDKLLWNMKRLLCFLLPLYIFWRLFDRKSIANPEGMSHFYGWTLKGFDAKPYLLMLLIVLPGVIWASYQPDFLRSYPAYVPGRFETESGISPWLSCGVFELVYGLDYALIELFFRGFMVIGMVKWLGRQAILPMVAVYCFLHFGKPMGETISSIFGGYILGVIALYSRSIWGGIIVHMGLAWMMEFWAWMRVIA